MDEVAVSNLQVIHLIIYAISLFLFIFVSLKGVKYPDNKKYWTRAVFPAGAINGIIFLLYTFWV